MKKIKILSISLMSILLLLSTSVFANDMTVNKGDLEKQKNSSTEIVILRAATRFQDKGGWGEFGYGTFHAWAKYTHPYKTHRVVLRVANSYHYGAYELAGPQNYSYKEAKTGDYVDAYGEVK